MSESENDSLKPGTDPAIEHKGAETTKSPSGSEKEVVKEGATGKSTEKIKHMEKPGKTAKAELPAYVFADNHANDHKSDGIKDRKVGAKADSPDTNGETPRATANKNEVAAARTANATGNRDFVVVSAVTAINNPEAAPAPPPGRLPPVPGKMLPAGDKPVRTVIETAVPQPPVPIIKDGKFVVKGEAEIHTTADGKIRLDRLDKKDTGFQMTPTDDGGIKWEHHGLTKMSNFKYTVTPDGKGGNNVHWQRADGMEKTYHWAPKNNPAANGSLRVPAIGNPVSPKSSRPQREVESMAPIPVSEANGGSPILDNGKGSRISRSVINSLYGLPGDKEGDAHFCTITSDNQGNQIRIEENGILQIENKNNHGVYNFVPTEVGYSMSSFGAATEDGIVVQGMVNGNEVTTRSDGITEEKKSDGTLATTKYDDQGLKTTWFKYTDGTTQTEKVKTDGGTSSWTHPPDYPDGGYIILDKEPDWEEPHGPITIPHEGNTYIHDNKKVRPLAEVEQTKVEKKHHLRGSRDADNSRDNQYDKVRNWTLDEARKIDKTLAKFPADPKKEIEVVFFDGQNLHSETTAGFYGNHDGKTAIGINPRAFNSKAEQGHKLYECNAEDSEITVFAHEMSHDLTFRLDPKGYKDGTLERQLAKVFGMHLVEQDPKSTPQTNGNTNETRAYKPVNAADSSDRSKRIWLIEGEELVGGQMQTFYYQTTGSGGEAIRCNISGNPVDLSGKIIDPKKEKEFIKDIHDVAKTKLSTHYAYRNPKEAAAETWVSYGINEESRAHLYDTTSAAVRDWIEQADQKIINAAKVNEPIPEGWIRVPSGDIVPGTKENIELLQAFMEQHAGKKNKQ